MFNINIANKYSIALLAFLILTPLDTFGGTSEMLQVGNAKISYETAGRGTPIVFIHAGVADSRQWNNEFLNFSESHSVIRYDMRGFGKSEPSDDEFSHLGDLIRLLDHLDLDTPVILIGCSMGGGTALDFALEEPDRVRALVLVDSAPSGLQIDLPTPPKFKLVEEAAKAGDLELVSEIETQIWFDGDRPTEKVDQAMRKLAYEMNLNVLRQDERKLGTRLPNTTTPAIERLGELKTPVLAIVGENDIPYMHAAVEVMAEKMGNYRHVTISNAGHLPNMDQPEEFESIVKEFLKSVAN